MDALTGETVERYLRARGIAAHGTVRQLAGGVSSVVFRVGDLVVKQPLERFLVPDEWVAKRERVLVEAAALRLAASIESASVPAVVDVDEERLVLVMEAAPNAARPWKDALLRGDADTSVAGRLGRRLRALHQLTSDDPDVARTFGDPEIFEQQRAEPYYRVVMARRPELAEAIGGRLGELLGQRRCLVHGDWTPKNVLVWPGGMWVVDWEVAHHGNPVFDAASLVNHLMLKAIHRPRALDGYRAGAEAFLAGYGSRPPDLCAHVACLMVARTDGRSPAEYLTPPQRDVARGVATSVLLGRPQDLDEMWALLRARISGVAS